MHKEIKCLRKNCLTPLPKPLTMEQDGNMVSLGQLNVQGLGCKVEGKYKDILNEMDLQLLDVLCITETHLKKEDGIAVSDFWNDKDGSVYRFDRDGSRGGGVILIMSNKYQHRLINIPNCGIEAVVAEITCPKKIYVIGIYILPCQNKALAMDGLGRILAQLEHNDEAHIIVMGDFNEDLLEIKETRYMTISQGKALISMLRSQQQTMDHF